MNEAEMFKLAEKFDEDFLSSDFANLEEELEEEFNNSEFTKEIAEEKAKIASNEEKSDKLAQNINKNLQNESKIEEKVEQNSLNLPLEGENKGTFAGEGKLQNAQSVGKIKDKKKTLQNNNKFKEQYFSYYDDIKIPSHKVTDW